MKQLDKYSRRLAAAGAGHALALAVPSFAAAQKAGAAVQSAGADAAKETAVARKKPAAGKGVWSLKVSKDTPRTYTVKATGANLSDITGELGRLLKVPVVLSPVMEKQRVNLDFAGLNLEATLRMLAPHPYVDYEAGGDDPQPKPLTLYLNALNERPPSTSAAVKSSSEAVLIEGDTEEGTEEYEKKKEKEGDEPALSVSYRRNQLSVVARKQPLTVVLFKIAGAVGIPFEMRYETNEIVDVEFKDYTLEQALRSLSPRVRLFYRADLQTFEVQPLRISLVAPAPARS